MHLGVTYGCPECYLKNSTETVVGKLGFGTSIEEVKNELYDRTTRMSTSGVEQHIWTECLTRFGAMKVIMNSECPECGINIYSPGIFRSKALLEGRFIARYFKTKFKTSYSESHLFARAVYPTLGSDVSLIFGIIGSEKGEFKHNIVLANIIRPVYSSVEVSSCINEVISSMLNLQALKFGGLFKTCNFMRLRTRISQAVQSFLALSDNSIEMDEVNSFVEETWQNVKINRTRLSNFFEQPVPDVFGDVIGLNDSMDNFSLEVTKDYPYHGIDTYALSKNNVKIAYTIQTNNNFILDTWRRELLQHKRSKVTAIYLSDKFRYKCFSCTTFASRGRSRDVGVCGCSNNVLRLDDALTI